MTTDHGIHIATTIQVQLHLNGVVRVGATARSFTLGAPYAASKPRPWAAPKLPTTGC